MKDQLVSGIRERIIALALPGECQSALMRREIELVQARGTVAIPSVAVELTDSLSRFERRKVIEVKMEAQFTFAEHRKHR